VFRLFRRLAAEESGQDLIEYALVAALIGLGGLAAIQELGAAMGGSYQNVNAATDDLWIMPEPGAGP